MRNQFVGAGKRASLTYLWILGQTGNGITEKFIHSSGRAGVVRRDVIPDVCPVLFRFWRPQLSHLAGYYLVAPGSEFSFNFIICTAMTGPH